MDLADLARAAKDRRGGEMRGENYRSTGGVREASANARGAGRASSQHRAGVATPGRSGPHTSALVVAKLTALLDSDFVRTPQKTDKTDI